MFHHCSRRHTRERKKPIRGMMLTVDICVIQQHHSLWSSYVTASSNLIIDHNILIHIKISLRLSFSLSRSLSVSPSEILSLIQFQTCRFRMMSNGEVGSTKDVYDSVTACVCRTASEPHFNTYHLSHYVLLPLLRTNIFSYWEVL